MISCSWSLNTSLWQKRKWQSCWPDSIQIWSAFTLLKCQTDYQNLLAIGQKSRSSCSKLTHCWPHVKLRYEKVFQHTHFTRGSSVTSPVTSFSWLSSVNWRRASYPEFSLEIPWHDILGWNEGRWENHFIWKLLCKLKSGALHIHYNGKRVSYSLKYYRRGSLSNRWWRSSDPVRRLDDTSRTDSYSEDQAFIFL